MNVPSTPPTPPRRIRPATGLLMILTLLFATIATSSQTGAAPNSDPPLTWNPEGKESPEPYGYDVHTAPDLPLGYTDPNDPPATLEIPTLDQRRALLDVTTTLDRTAYSWFGSVTVSAEVRFQGNPVLDCDAVTAVSAANPRVTALLSDDGVAPDITAGDGIYSGIFEIGAGEGEARPTGNYTVTATAQRGEDLGQDTSPNFSVYSVRRWTGITTSNLPDTSDRYTTFFAEPIGVGAGDGGGAGAGGGYHHTILELGLIRSTPVSDAQIRIPILPDANAVTGLTVSGPGIANVELHGNVIAFECDLTGSNVTRVDIEFDAPSDLAATLIDRYQTGDIGLRNFRNGYQVWNRFLKTAIFGTATGGLHGPGAIADLHAIDQDTGDPHTVDCMERVAVHLDDTAVNDGSGTYPSNIKWEGDALSWLETSELGALGFRFFSGANYGVRDRVQVERHVDFYPEAHYFRHHYEMENIDTESHDFDFVWGREQWLYGTSGTNRQSRDRGIVPNDATDYGGEFLLDGTALSGNWFAAYDNSSIYSIGVVTTGTTADALPTLVHLSCQPPLGNFTGQYPIVPSGSCSDMPNLFFEKQLGNVAPGESVSYEFYQWCSYASSRAELTTLLWEDADALAQDPASVDNWEDEEAPVEEGTGQADNPGTTVHFAAPSPQPMTIETELVFDVLVPGQIRLAAFDVRGRHVRSLVDTWLPAGRHVHRWEGDGPKGTRLPSGLYFLRLEAHGVSQVQKVSIRR